MDSKGAFGAIIVFAGLVQIIGAVTGNEAPMIAALVDSSILTSTSGNPATPQKSSVTGILQGAVGGGVGTGVTSGAVKGVA